MSDSGVRGSSWSIFMVDSLVIMSTNFFFLIKAKGSIRKITSPAFNFVFGRHLRPKLDFFATV